MTHLLDNIMWHALSGPHAKYATGNERVRRYAPGFSPFVGFVAPQQPDLAALSNFCEPGERLYCASWIGPEPAGWRIEVESTMLRMVWDAPMPSKDEASETVALGPAHTEQVLQLAELTRPGPFGPKTIGLGDYFGCFDGDRLIAMAGERMRAGSFREISGVCTHPHYQGRGLARKLIRKLVRRQMQRNETPFLHVLRDNHGARPLYERMGFRNYKEVVARVISPLIAGR